MSSKTAEDARVKAGTERLLEGWRERLGRGEARLGWKIAINAKGLQEKLGLKSAVFGFMTGDSVIEPGTRCSLAGFKNAAVEAEIAIRLGRDVEPGGDREAAAGAIASLAPALEIIDLDRPPDDLAELIATNIYHRHVVFGPADETRAGGSLEGLRGKVLLNGEIEAEVDPKSVYGEMGDIVRLVADLLGAFGERLRAGDRIIAGTMAKPTRIGPGDRVQAAIDGLGQVEIEFSS